MATTCINKFGKVKVTVGLRLTGEKKDALKKACYVCRGTRTLCCNYSVCYSCVIMFAKDHGNETAWTDMQTDQ